MSSRLARGMPALLLAIVVILSAVKVVSGDAARAERGLSVSMDIFTYMGTATNAEYAYDSFQSLGWGPHELWYGRFTKTAFLENLHRFDILYYNGWAAPGVLADGNWPYGGPGDTYIWANEIKAAVPTPYKFAFLDTCATAEDDQLANALGIYAGDRGRAMLGWASITYDTYYQALFTRTVFDMLMAGATLEEAAVEATSRSTLSIPWRIVGDPLLTLEPGPPAPTPTRTTVPSPTASATSTAPPSATPTITPPPTMTGTATETPTITTTPTVTPTSVKWGLLTRTPTSTPTTTNTAPPTQTPTPSSTRTVTLTPTPSRTPTVTATPEATSTPSVTPTAATPPVIDVTLVAQASQNGITYATVAPSGQNVTVNVTGPFSFSWQDSAEGMLITMTFAGRVDSLSPLALTAFTFAWSTDTDTDSVTFNQQHAFSPGSNDYTYGPVTSSRGLEYSIWGTLVVR